MKKYVLLAGGNGAGKSTLYQTLDSLQKMERVNTDEIVRNLGDWRKTSDVMAAGRIAVTKIKEYFENGVSFNQETTLCGNSIIRNIEHLIQIMEKCDLVVFYDNTEVFKRFALYERGAVVYLAESIPLWFKKIFDNTVLKGQNPKAEKANIAMEELSKDAAENGTSEMPLAEIKKEIEIANMDIVEKNKENKET